MKMLHKKFHKGTKIILAAAICTTIASASSAQVPIADGVVRSNTARIAGETAQINNTTRQMNDTVQDLQDAVGNAGNMPSPLQGALGNAAGSGSEFYENMQRFGSSPAPRRKSEN